MQRYGNTIGHPDYCKDWKWWLAMLQLCSHRLLINVVLLCVTGCSGAAWCAAAIQRVHFLLRQTVQITIRQFLNKKWRPDHKNSNIHLLNLPRFAFSLSINMKLIFQESTPGPSTGSAVTEYKPLDCQSYIRIIQLRPFFFFAFFSVAHRGLAVVITLHRARISFCGSGSCSQLQVRRRGAPWCLTAKQLYGQPLKSGIQKGSEHWSHLAKQQPKCTQYLFQVVDLLDVATLGRL